MLELNVDVWQFVRIMVELEEGRPINKKVSKSFRASPVYLDWRKTWETLDRQLEGLSKTNHSAFSDLMMEEQVLLQVRSKAQLNEVISAIERVIRRIGHLQKNSDSPDQLESFRFEKKRLSELKRDLVVMKP